MSNELARIVTRSMRVEPNRWEAPDHGWNFDLFCRRDDGLEVMQDRDAELTAFGYRPGSIRIQGLGAPGNHYSQSMQLKAVRFRPTWLNAAGTLLREMKALHRDKYSRESDAALRTLRGT